MGTELDEEHKPVKRRFWRRNISYCSISVARGIGIKVSVRELSTKRRNEV